MADDTPVGTKAEIIACGEHPQNWGSCAPSQPGPQGERGCRFYSTCVFTSPEYGNFRDHGPRNVGVLKVLDATNAAREDVMECFSYMNLVARDELSKKTGEHFTVVAQEGEEIHTHTFVPELPSGESNRSSNQKLKEVIGDEDKPGEPFLVPKFPRPGEPGSKIRQNVISTRRVLEMRQRTIKQAESKRVLDRGNAPKETRKSG